ncbi:MAG: LPS assembly protein LptD [Pseudomonadota bacterium]
MLATNARAQQLPPLCGVNQFPVDTPQETGLAEGQVAFESGSGRYTLGGDAVLSNGVAVQQGEFRFDADSGKFDRDESSLALFGNIRYSGGGANIVGQEALLSYLYGRVEFRDAVFQLGYGASRGAASLLRIDQSGKIRLRGVNYTSCPPDKDDWIVKADRITLNTVDGVGEARNLSLRFKDVPILYTPYLSFPISAQRKTGFLLPNIGQSGLNGLDISLPWYWNIAPNYDATFTPRLLSRRGVQLTASARYLTEFSSGNVEVAHLPGDDLTRLDRTLFRWNNTTDFGDRWRAFADITDVSDDQYLEDLGGSLSSASATHLDRTAGVAYRGRQWRADARATLYQTIDDQIVAEDEPYRLLPAIRLQGLWDDIGSGFGIGLDAEVTHFERELGVTGERFHVAPSLSWEVDGGGYYIRPELQWLYTHYRLKPEADPIDETQTRSLPIATLDAGLRFERELKGGTLRQTLEPHIYYVHVPFRDQSDIPVFDTILPVASLEQLYRANRYIGLDRIGDTDQLTFGVSTRLATSDTGRTVLRATLGQTRYLSTQSVILPGEITQAGNSSDYIAELSLNFWGDWNVDLTQQWNTERDESTQSEFRLQYNPGDGRVVNVAYRFRRDAVDQGDISWSWPIASQWNVVGRYNYSFLERASLERFVGVEYESCCWGLRIVSRRYISRRDGTADTSVAIQLELKGLTSVGDPADKLLERGILGYTTRR